MNEKLKKLIPILVIVGIILYFGFQASVTAKYVPIGKSDPGISLKACVSDQSGNCAPTTKTQSIVTFQGQTAQPGYKYITVFSDITNILGGNVEVDVTDISSPQSDYQTAINTGQPTASPPVLPYLKQFTLQTAQTNSQFAVWDISQPASWGSHLYQMDVAANYKDAQGNAVSIPKSGQVGVLIESDVCTDNTPWNTCSASKPSYCQAGQLYPPEYIPGTLIDKASVCGCAVGYVPNPGNPDQCVANVCNDGTTPVGSCVVGNPNTNQRYCSALGQPLIEACGQCDCTNDYHNNPNTACDAGDHCVYTIYSADLNVYLRP